MQGRGAGLQTVVGARVGHPNDFHQLLLQQHSARLLHPRVGDFGEHDAAPAAAGPLVQAVEKRAQRSISISSRPRPWVLPWASVF